MLRSLNSLSARTDGPRIAVAFPRRISAPPHEVASHCHLTQRLAILLGRDFIVDYDPLVRNTVDNIYYVPYRTLVEPGAAGSTEEQLMNLSGLHDLFGGVVPYPFVGTKAITHSLVDRDARAPIGWSKKFGEHVRQAVLQGATVFSPEDARRAGAVLIRAGPVRIKPVLGIGGRGQNVVESQSALNDAIEEQNATELNDCGLVLEQHLDDVCTYSVGHVSVGDLVVTYVGTQSLTRDNAGEMVYGGSDLLFARGEFEALLAINLTDAEREAVRLARIYDAAALRCYPGLYASRRNYDVAQGKDIWGRVRTGVLEQSWRAGGASVAEACALEAFHRAPDLRTLRAFTCERYGAQHPQPAPAQLVYRGQDTEIGFITKYGGISSYGDK